MPGQSGRIRGIVVPEVPWHKGPPTDEQRESLKSQIAARRIENIELESVSVTKYPLPGMKFHTGGVVSGSDTVPAWLNNDYVITRAQADALAETTICDPNQLSLLDQ